MHGVLFTYGGDRASHGPHQFSGPYAVIDFQTTGLAPRGADRVIEVALVRVEADGTVGEPWSTLVNPGRDTGVPFIHKIDDGDVAEAPTFAQIAPYLLSQLDGAVVVAHNAPFDEEFWPQNSAGRATAICACRACARSGWPSGPWVTSQIGSSPRWLASSTSR